MKRLFERERNRMPVRMRNAGTAAAVVVDALLLPGAGHADIIRCSFTEPFIETVYSTTASTLKITYSAEGRSETLGNISFQIIKAGLFELWNSKREVIQRVELSLRGSDGMGDRVYPYAVYWIPKHLHGGCTSTHLK